MSPKPTRTPRLPPEIRRRQILDATRRAIDASGFAQLTVDQIAREAGITRPVIYDVFGDFAGLLDAFIEDVEQQALEAIGGALPDPNLDDPPDKMLSGAFETFLESVRAKPEIWRIVLLPPEGSPAAIRGRVEGRRSELIAGIAELVDIAAERHDFLDGVNRQSFSRILIAMAEDMGRLVLSQPKAYTPARIARATGGVARLLPPGKSRPKVPGSGGALGRGQDHSPAPGPVSEDRSPDQPSWQMSRRDRSAQLLDLALEIVVSDGYEGFSMAAVAAAAGVSRPIVYRSYPNQAALLLTLLRREQKRVERRLDEAIPKDPGGRHPRDVLIGAVRGVLDAVADSPLSWRFVLLLPEGTPRPVQELVSRRRDRFLRRARRLVRWGVPYVDSDEQLDLEILSRFLVSIIEEQARTLLTEPSISKDDLIASTEAVIGAVGWRTAPQRPV